MIDPMAAWGSKQHQSWKPTLFAGLGTILVCQALLFVDVSMRGWAVMPYQEIAPPEGVLQTLGRWIAYNMTPICWVAFLFALDGALTLLERRCDVLDISGGSPIRKRPKRFVLCFLMSVPIWLVFDGINFSFMGAWKYHGLSENILHDALGYFLAFGAISPAMFLTAEFYRQLGLGRLRGRQLQIGPHLRLLSIGIGIVMIGYPFIVREPIGSLTLWMGWLFLLDPVNHWFGAPSLIDDWRHGRWGRMFALMAGGATCGLLWEFWNYWATAKWTYDLPFLGPLEEYRYFEMPLVGLLGFPPFALECWVMFQTIVLFFAKSGFRFAEPLPEKHTIL